MDDPFAKLTEIMSRYPTNEANWRMWSLNDTLSHYRRLITTIVDAIHRESLSKIKEFEAFIKTVPPDEEGDYEYAFGEHEQELRETMPATIWCWLFVGLYSFLETELEAIYAWYIRNRKLVDVKLPVIQQSIDDAKTFLKTQCGVKDVWGSRSWCEIQAYRKLRSTIVHHHGRASGKYYEDVVQFSQKQKTFAVVDGKVVITKDLCLSFMATVENFLKLILRSLDEEDQAVAKQNASKA